MGCITTRRFLSCDLQKHLHFPPSRPSSGIARREAFIHPCIHSSKPSYRTATHNAAQGFAPLHGKGGACSREQVQQLGCRSTFPPVSLFRESALGQMPHLRVVRALARPRGLGLLLVPRGAVRTCPGGNGYGARSPRRPRVRGKIRR